tara:strand:- start:308 stop:586 length:279 start_codon:yes stop_codon:yes gene_type:complete
MNKSEIVESLFKNNEFLSKKDTEDTLNLIIDCLSNTLSNGYRVEIRGFGSFSVRKRKERIARNPKTGKSVAVTTKFHPYFRASKSLKQALNP